VIIDSSALVAIMFAEGDAAIYARAIRAARERRISAVNYVETAVVVDGRRDPVISRRFDDLLREASIIIEPFDEIQAHVAREAYRDFGRGSGHRARLNFGDCFAYALARCRGEPLLFKGDDFSQTDIAPKLP
jgi:ribonuclease VapC